MGKSISKNKSKNLSGKYSPGILATRQSFLDHAKKSATDALKTASKIAIQKAEETTSDLIGNKIANRITKVSNNSEQVTNDQGKDIPKKRFFRKEDKKMN